MKFTKNTILLATAMLFVLTGCKKEGCTDSTATNYDADAKKDDGSCTFNTTTTPSYTTPATFDFTDADGNNTVSYGGQTDRMNMLSEMVTYLKTANGPDENGTNATLDSVRLHAMYSNDAAANWTGTVGSSGKDLESKTAGSSTIQMQFKNWMSGAAAATPGTQNGYLVNADGYEWTQLIEKGLMGACFAYQITENYLTDNKIGVTVNNLDASDTAAGKYYTSMEHHWDEGYGYFTDNNDFAQGTNRFWTKYANKGYMNGLGDEIAEAFRTGRAAITASRIAGGDGLTYHADVLAQRDIIVAKVHRMAAGMAIHYLYDVKNSVAGGSSANDVNHSFSEAYAFMYGLHTLNGGAWASDIAGMLAMIDGNPQGFIASSQSIDGTITAIAQLAGITDPESFE
jgi:hypothetical protein